MKVYPVSGKCSLRGKKFGLQISTDGGENKIIGHYRKSDSSSAMARTRSELELEGDVLMGTLDGVGCPICGSPHLIICPHCSSFVCYDGNEHTMTCPECGKTFMSSVGTPGKVSWPKVESAEKRAILLLFDTSGSMADDNKMKFVQNACKQSFINKIGTSDVAMVATFGETGVQVACNLTTDKRLVNRIIDSLVPAGGTPQPLGVISRDERFKDFRNFNGKRIILFFTDGIWAGPKSGSINASAVLRDMGITIIGVRTKDADGTFIDSICTQGASFLVAGSDFESEVKKAFKISFNQ